MQAKAHVRRPPDLLCNDGRFGQTSPRDCAVDKFFDPLTKLYNIH